MLVDLVRQRDQGMFSNKAHFIAGRGNTALDLVPDRLDQCDRGYKDCLLMILQIIFSPGLSEQQSLGNQTAPDANPYTGSRQHNATRRGPEAYD